MQYLSPLFDQIPITLSDLAITTIGLLLSIFCTGKTLRRFIMTTGNTDKLPTCWRLQEIWLRKVILQHGKI